MPPEQQEKKTQIHKNENEHNQVTKTSQVPSPQQNKHKQMLGIKFVHLCNLIVI
jgi:hypothetical protein